MKLLCISLNFGNNYNWRLCENILIIAFEYVKYYILNCRERYQHMTDHCSYTDNLNSREIKACPKKFRPE